MKEFRDLLREIMEERDLKAVDVSELTGIGSGAVSMYLSGTRTPKVDTIRKFARGLNVSDEWLLGYSDVSKERMSDTQRRIRGMELENQMSEDMLDYIVQFYASASFSTRVDIFGAVKKIENELNK